MFIIIFWLRSPEMLSIYIEHIFQPLLVFLLNLSHRFKKLFGVAYKNINKICMVSISWCYLQKWKRLLSSNDQMFTLLSFSYSNNNYIYQWKRQWKLRNISSLDNGNLNVSSADLKCIFLT